ncbi:alpha/beta fold hydrolase [Microbacterium sp. NPDC058345]|uniref:alpha/beta fold hydrolase n=1 Tax=Microbacterium sp. NPDC058345 TaxID=3346455 RepID=UPI003652AB7E
MLLNTLESGSGERVVLLLHGLMGSAESWWRIGSLLAGRGHRVLALDLPGHGLSARDAQGTVASAADAVIATVEGLTGGAPLSAMGHSYGGTVLAAAADRLPLECTVYVDTACHFPGGADRVALAARYEADRRRRTDPTWLRTSRPFYSQTDAEVEARAAERFDPATAASISAGADVSHVPEAGSILIRARPSSYVSDAEAGRLSLRGVQVRDVPGAAHTVWYSHFDRFCALLPEVFAG